MVDRFWLRDGAPLTLSEDGFLPDPEAEAEPGRGARSSLEIEAIDCLVLLGDAGIGKSTALRQQYRRRHLSSVGSADRALLVDLSAARDPSDLRFRIFGGEDWERWHEGAGRLHLFLDSLDGAVMGVRAVGDVLREGLADVPWDRLSLRIACRTADRCRSLESWLHRHVGPDRFAVYQLLPLRRRDARAAAARRVPHPDRWLGGVVEAGLAPLAASPLTLRMLLDIAVTRRALPASRTAVYEAACELACREAGESRRAGRRRLENVQRLTGRLVLTGWASLAAEAAGADRLRDRSQGEFLCARWLAGTASAEEIDGLLFADVDGRLRVIPQLREVAAALASQSPEFASVLLERDPQVLLRADPASWRHEDDGALVRALLAGVASHRIGRFEPFVRWTLPRLCGAEVGDDLLRVLADPPPGTAVRETIADIAAACRLRPLEDALVALAHDPAQASSVRAAAVGALSRFASDETCRRLLPLAIESQEDDAIGEFLPRHLMHGVREEELVAALDWAAGVPSGSTAGVAVREALLVRAASRLDDDAVVAAFGAVAARVIGAGEVLVSAEAPGLLDDAAGRRRLLARLIAHHAVDPAALVTSAPALARPCDLEWATGRHLERVGAPDEQRWAELVDALLERRDGDGRIREARELGPVIADRGMAAVGDPEPFPPRERGPDEHGRPDPPQPFDVRSKVASAIALWADGDVDGFWATLAWMEEVDPSRVGAASDPRRLPGWPLVDGDVREWVVAAAPRYLRAACVRPRELVSGRVDSEPARAGYRALRLLCDEDPHSLAVIPDAVWARWAPIIVDWPRDGDGERRFNAWAISELVGRAPDAAAECLDAALARDLRDGRGAASVRRFAGALTAPVERVVLKHAMRRRTPWQHRAELLDFLLGEGSQAAWQRARRLVTPSGVRDQPELAVAVASRLAAHAPDGEWRRLWRRITSDDDFGHRLIELLATERERPVIERLAEAQLADLFAWIRSRPARDSRTSAWSDRLLETLAARGSPDAVAAFDRLALALPEVAAVQGMRLQAVEAARRPAWAPHQAGDVELPYRTPRRRRRRPGPSVPVTWSRLLATLPGILSRPEVHAALPIAVVALAALSVRSVRMESMSDLGLVSVLPVTTILLVLGLTWSFCWSLARAPLRQILPLLHVVALIVIVYGATIYLERDPRFAIVWKHAGIVDYIDGHHSVDPGLDAYFNWPGFFILGDFFTRVAGFRSLIDFGAWGPLAFNLLFLPALVAIFRWATDDRRALWFAVWIFYSANWVAQDYLAPQAVGYLIWLAIAVVLLRWLTPAPVTLPAGERAWPPTAVWKAHRDRMTARLPQLRSAGRSGLVGLVVVLYAAVVMGHQLTPFAIFLVVTALVVLAGLSTRGLPVLMVVLTAVWISYGAKTYLDGHASVLLGPLSSFGENLHASVGARLAGSPQHLVIVRIRLVFTALIWALAIAGMIRRLVNGRFDVALIAIAVAPALLPVVQPYGGEMLLRVFYFVLPPAAFFVAGLVFPRPDRGRRPLAYVAAAGLASVLVVGFLFARYGNERLDYFTPGDVAAVNRLYDVAPRGAVLFAGAPNLPWQERDYDLYEYRNVVGLDGWAGGRPRSRELLAEMRTDAHGRPLYVIITRSTRIRAALLDGEPGALGALTATLRRSPGVHRIYARGGASIFRIRPAQGGVTVRAARASPARSPYG